jgi:plastocyanin
MHTVALQLAPVLAAEKSKVPFYVAGGALVVWALLVSLLLGMRKADFPGNLAGQRAVSAITAVLVLAAVATAVITSGTPARSAAATTSAQPSSGGSEAASTTGSSTAASTTGAATTPSTPTGTTATAKAPAPPTPAGAATQLKLAANPGGLLAYDTKQLSAKAGTVTITMANSSPVEHNFTIAQGSTVLGATPKFTGGSRTLTLKLKPGTYTFFCSVPGHRQAGMEGTLKVS